MNYPIAEVIEQVRAPLRTEVIAVSDGSMHGTGLIVDRLHCEQQINFAIDHPYRCGKGVALPTGVRPAGPRSSK